MAKLNVADLMRDRRTRTVLRGVPQLRLEACRLPRGAGPPAPLSVGSSCGKPAVALSSPLIWTEENTQALEALAWRDHSYPTCDRSPRPGSLRWTSFGVVDLRAEYDQAAELLRDLITLKPHDAPSGQERTTP